MAYIRSQEENGLSLDMAKSQMELYAGILRNDGAVSDGNTVTICFLAARSVLVRKVSRAVGAYVRLSFWD